MFTKKKILPTLCLKKKQKYFPKKRKKENGKYFKENLVK